MKIILIAGKAQAGKSSLAYFLQSHLRSNQSNEGSYTFNLADSLKDACRRFFTIPNEWMHGTNEDKNRLTHIRFKDLPIVFHNEAEIDPDRQLTVRQLLQYFGTEIMRKMDQNVWCNATAEDIDNESFERESEASLRLSYAIIGDVRFPNEIKYFVNRYGEDNVIIVRLIRNITNLTHASEIALDNHDFSQYKNYIEIDNTSLSEVDKNVLALQLVREMIKKG